MGVEIVHHQMDVARCGINLLEQVLYKSDKVGLGTMISDYNCLPSSLGFHCHEQIAGSGTFVLIMAKIEQKTGKLDAEQNKKIYKNALPARLKKAPISGIRLKNRFQLK